MSVNFGPFARAEECILQVEIIRRMRSGQSCAQSQTCLPSARANPSPNSNPNPNPNSPGASPLAAVRPGGQGFAGAAEGGMSSEGLASAAAACIQEVNRLRSAGSMDDAVQRCESGVEELLAGLKLVPSAGERTRPPQTSWARGKTTNFFYFLCATMMVVYDGVAGKAGALVLFQGDVPFQPRMRFFVPDKGLLGYKLRPVYKWGRKGGRSSLSDVCAGFLCPAVAS